MWKETECIGAEVSKVPEKVDGEKVSEATEQAPEERVKEAVDRITSQVGESLETGEVPKGAEKLSIEIEGAQADKEIEALSAAVERTLSISDIPRDKPGAEEGRSPKTNEQEETDAGIPVEESHIEGKPLTEGKL